jgi:Kef-type K+ transport system membrane component KefB
MGIDSNVPIFIGATLCATSIGIGLVPMGEVGLIFACIGKSIGILDDSLFSVIIVVVLLTTMVTPPMLKWAIERKERGE